MRTYIYDTEVTSHDWIAVFKDIDTGEKINIHNDPEHLKDLIEPEALYVGFNVKHYDSYIIRYILSGASPEEVKRLNDFIIKEGRNGFDFEPLKGFYISFNQCDLMDDCQQGLSLKAIEAHLGMNIVESSVDFDIDRPLTDEEVREMTLYCGYDVDATEVLYNLRQNYLNTKLYLGGLAGLADKDALYMTNAKLTAKYLGATRTTDYNDERDYVYPSNLLREYIPQPVIDFFERLHNKAYSDEEIFKGEKLEFSIGKCECKIGWGGIHGAIPKYREKATAYRTIRNQDVASYYPHLLTLDGYISRNIPEPKKYADMLEERMRAKKAGDKDKANALKLVANTTYGGMLNPYNDLYDAKNARSVCITGQLRLLELANHLVADCPTLKVVQLNTDGIMVSLDNEDVPTYTAICKEWQDRTGFELEEDCISEIIQKDVNGYIEIATNGKPKIKGGYLVRGIAPAGAFNINNNATIVSKAVVDYFVNHISTEKTIHDCNDILEFQLVAKASHKYKAVYHYVKGKPVPVQKCNRVYATDDPNYGTLIKIHAETGAEAKVAGLPEHCLIDNDNHLSIDDISKDWYVTLANEYIDSFIGCAEQQTNLLNLIEGEYEMATKKETPTDPPKEETTAKIPKEIKTDNLLNLYQKLLLIRMDWLSEKITPTGINSHAEFKYFELADIVPVVTALCIKYHCLFLTDFAPDGAAIGRLIDLDDIDRQIMFAIPITQIAEPAKFRMNEIQATGAMVTYYRRYLYSMLLDIVDPDKIDVDLPEKPAAKIPPTVEERAEIKETVVDKNGQADELQIEGLKKAMKRLIELNPEEEETVNKLLLKTDGLSNITKEECENYITVIGAMISEEENLPWNG